MSVVIADLSISAQLAAMQARLDAAESAAKDAESKLAAVKARASGAAGWHEKEIKDLTEEQIEKGSKKGLFSAERKLPGGLLISYYVGGNGKLTVGGTYATRGVTLWIDEVDALSAYRADMGPDGEKADFDRIVATGTWGTGEGVAKKKK